MATDHARKLNDVHTTWTQVLDVDADLTAITGDVTLYVEAPDGTLAVNGSTVTVDSADTVSYQFLAGDLTQPGGHKAEFHINHDGAGDIEIQPTNDWFEIRVYDELST